MTDVLAVVSGGARDGAVRVTAAAMAALLDERVSELTVPARSDVVAGTERVLAALGDASSVLGVLAAERSPGALCWRVVGRAAKPVVLVPPRAAGTVGAIRRALVPLDGTYESTLAVAETIRLLDRAGTDLIVLHVFDASTAPSFWDQPAHAYQAWVDEFRSRSTAPRSARLELRSGSPGERVVNVASEENVDLIALAWSQRLEPKRARTVRTSVLEARVPVLLVPINPHAVQSGVPFLVPSGVEGAEPSSSRRGST